MTPVARRHVREGELADARKLLPRSKTLSMDRTLRALVALQVPPVRFAEAYRKAASKRGRGTSKPSETVLEAFQSYQESGDFAQFSKAVGARDTARATALLGRCYRWDKENSILSKSSSLFE